MSNKIVKEDTAFPRCYWRRAQVEYAVSGWAKQLNMVLWIRGTAEHPVVVKKGSKVMRYSFRENLFVWQRKLSNRWFGDVTFS